MKCHYTRPLLSGNFHQPNILTGRVWLEKEMIFFFFTSDLEVKEYFFPRKWQNGLYTAGQSIKSDFQHDLQLFLSQDSHTISDQPSQHHRQASADSSPLGSPFIPYLFSALLNLPVSLLAFFPCLEKDRSLK